jgi:c(7)-type cytochrome triheme protein
MARSSGVNYVPSWMEFTVTTFIVVLGFALFGLAVKHLEVFPKHEEAETVRGVNVPKPVVFQWKPIATLWVLLLVGVALLGLANARDGQDALDNSAAAADVSLPHATWQSERYSALLIPTAEDSPGPVYFDHSTHVDLSAPDCGQCHPQVFPITAEAVATTTPMLMEEMEDGRWCGKCHNGEDAFASDEDCDMCHVE